MMSNILLEPRVAIPMNLGLILLIIPIMSYFPHNFYALILALSLPTAHFGYLIFEVGSERQNLREEKQ